MTSVMVLAQYARLPRLADRIIDAIELFNDSGAACRHVAAGGNERILCAAHPQTLMCMICAEGHVAEHDYVLEHSCDECGALVLRIAPMCVPAEIDGYVRTVRGRDQHVAGSVAVAALGLCRACNLSLIGVAS